MKVTFFAIAVFAFGVVIRDVNYVSGDVVGSEKTGINIRLTENKYRVLTVDIQSSGGGDGSSPMVQTSSGLARGTTQQGAHAFYEIPYAKPPVGNLRFQDPQPAEDAGTIDASINDQIVCYQGFSNCTDGRCFTNLKEDCLILNVFVPLQVDLSNSSLPPTDRLPVFINIHGGSFLSGAGTEQKYESQWLSNVTNSIVVSINYRLGVFGFFRYDAGEFKGNQGLKDQRLAMTWVQNNIQSFGGDESKVTLFGNSAGAQSILFHLVSSSSEALFHRAILQSLPHFFYQTISETTATTNFVLSILNCTDQGRQCLLDATPEALVEMVPELMTKVAVLGTSDAAEPLRPFVDGDDVKDQPINMFRDGSWQASKEIVFGTTIEEVTSFGFSNQFPGKLDKNSFYAYNRAIFGEQMGDAISAKYESLAQDAEDDFTAILAMEATNSIFTCPTRATARFASNSSDEKNVFLYTSAYAPSGTYCEEVYSEDEYCGTSFHTSELPVVFRSGPSFGYVFDDDDISVADQFNTYWGSFARTGDPSNGLEVPLRDVLTWPKYIEESWPGIQFQPPKEKVVNDYLEDICDFWDGLDYYVVMPDNAGKRTCASVLPWLLLALVSAWLQLY